MTEPVYFSLNTIGHLTQLYASPVIPKESNWLSLWLDGLRDMTFPVVFRQDNDTGGVKLVDFINTGWGSISGPVSDRVISLLRDEGFTGWDTYPIEVYLKDGSKLPGYQGLTVTGRCNGLDPAATEQIDIVVDMYGGPAMYDPDPLLDIETPNITDDILLSDVSDDLPDNIDTGNFDVCNDTYLV